MFVDEFQAGTRRPAQFHLRSSTFTASPSQCHRPPSRAPPLCLRCLRNCAPPHFPEQILCSLPHSSVLPRARCTLRAGHEREPVCVCTLAGGPIRGGPCRRRRCRRCCPSSTPHRRRAAAAVPSCALAPLGAAACSNPAILDSVFLQVVQCFSSKSSFVCDAVHLECCVPAELT